MTLFLGWLALGGDRGPSNGLLGQRANSVPLNGVIFLRDGVLRSRISLIYVWMIGGEPRSFVTVPRETIIS